MNNLKLKGFNYSIIDNDEIVLESVDYTNYPKYTYPHVVYITNRVFFNELGRSYVVKEIQESVFYCKITNECSLIVDVSVIGGVCFAYCSGISEIQLDKNVNKICGGAFRDCSKLILLDIGENVRIIEQNAFYNCNKLRRIECKAIKPLVLGVDAFKGVDAVLYVPLESIEDYRNATGWKEFKEIKELGGILL